MTYTPTIWINTVKDADGNVVQKGTPYTAENMNKIENELVIHSHAHENKEVLDQVNQDHVDYVHTHENKEVLDALTQQNLDDIASHGFTLTDHEQRLINIVETITSLKIKVVQTVSERDALANKESIIVHVVDATADSTVESGWAQYIYQDAAWLKIAENESIDVVLAWANIAGKPSTYPPSEHTHTKAQVGLPNVDNVKQATKSEFDAHNTDTDRHITPEERQSWNTKAGGAHTHNWDEINAKPTTFTPSAHAHAVTDVTGLLEFISEHAVNSVCWGDQEDPNTTQLSVMVSNHANTPDIASYWYVHTLFYGNKTGNKGQTALTYAFGEPRYFIRHHFHAASGWSTWVELANMNSLNAHAADNDKHTNATERTYWNSAATKVAEHTTTLSEFATHTHAYANLTGKPVIPTQTSQLTNDSNFVASNANKITVSATAPTSPQPNDIWIVI